MATPLPNTAGRALEDLAAERAVLGAVLADNAVIGDVGQILSPDDFSAAAHAQIFDAMIGLYTTQRGVDHLTLSQELKTRGQLASVGGPSYLMGLDQVVPVSANAPHYAKLVKDKAVRRRLALAASEILSLANQEAGDTDGILDEAQQRVFRIAEKKLLGDLKKVSELMEPTLVLLDTMQRSQSGVTGLSTGFVDLDLLLTGLHPGELIILAARPGVGKTSLAMNMAVHAALKEAETAVGVFSLEMPADQLLMRLLASEARVDMKKLRGGRLTAHDQEKFQDAAARLWNAPLYIDDTGALSPFDLRAKARRLKQKDPRLKLLVVDYLQLMHQKGRPESRQLEVAEISRSLKGLAKELGLPIVALSQLNRKVEERKGGKPVLSDLRESGAIEQDADVVMFIHRDEEGSGGDEGDPSPRRSAREVELIIAKQRNGPIGSIDLVFLSELTRFESRARGDFQ